MEEDIKKRYIKQTTSLHFSSVLQHRPNNHPTKSCNHSKRTENIQHQLSRRCHLYLLPILIMHPIPVGHPALLSNGLITRLFLQDNICARISSIERLGSASRSFGVDLDERGIIVFAPLFNLLVNIKYFLVKKRLYVSFTLPQATEMRIKLGSVARAFAWSLRAYSLNIRPTSLGF